MLDWARMRGRRYGKSRSRERHPRNERFRRGKTRGERDSREAKAQGRDERSDQEHDRYSDRDVPAKRIVDPLEVADRGELFGDFHCDEQAEATGTDSKTRQRRAGSSQAATECDEGIDTSGTSETDRYDPRDEHTREYQSDRRDGPERRVDTLTVVIGCWSTKAIDEIDDPVRDERRHARREEPCQPAQENAFETCPRYGASHRHVTTFS
jgi:hypothetical protein